MVRRDGQNWARPNLTDPEDLKLEIALSVRSRATCQNVSAPRAQYTNEGL